MLSCIVFTDFSDQPVGNTGSNDSRMCFTTYCVNTSIFHVSGWKIMFLFLWNEPCNKAAIKLCKLFEPSQSYFATNSCAILLSCSYKAQCKFVPQIKDVNQSFIQRALYIYELFWLWSHTKQYKLFLNDLMFSMNYFTTFIVG